jgi:WD40 repeat protein/type II secretory pathway predicted ATPase ExeA
MAMARVFVSHSGKDAALADEVHGWLIDGGHEVFLAQDLHAGILVGDQWEQRLHERLRWADAVVCVLTAAYLDSLWCTAELAIAQSRGSRLLPVRGEPGVSHPLLDATQYADMSEDRADARARLNEALLQLDAAGGGGWPDGRSPFPGLRALDTDEHLVFFGRSAEVGELASMLRSPAEQAERAVLLVVGPSGCGKSSLVRAGLLPVMAADSDWWTLPAFLPGAEPVAALARELAAAANHLHLSWTATDVRRRLINDGLTGLVDDLLLAVPGRRRRHLLVVVDQFEELLSQSGPEELARFARLLRDALSGPLQIVGTLRPEFLDPLLTSPELSTLPARTHALRPLRPEALRSVIEGPTTRAGIGIDDDLVTRLAADTGSGEALPLLAYALEQLATGARRGDRLTAARYEELGGVRGALVRQADAALADAVAAGGRGPEQVIKELLRLVTVDEQGRPTRWRSSRDEMPQSVLIELKPFVDRRLLTTDRQTGDVVLGVAHEAFLSEWPPLNEAITAAASALRARRQVEQAAAQWVEERRPPARLWQHDQLGSALADTGARLRSTRGMLSTASDGDASRPQRRLRPRWPRRRRTVVADRVDLSARARDFLTASIRRDRRERRRADNLLRLLVAVAVGAAIFAVDRQGDAEERERLATARLLISQAEETLARDPRTALRLNETAEYLRSNQETRSALLRNLLMTPYAGTLSGHTRAVNEVAVTAHGDTLASASGDGTVRLWDVTDPAVPRPLGTPLPHTSWVSAVAFTSDGRTLASASGDGTLRLWDVTDPAVPRSLGAPLAAHTGDVNAVAFAGDGHTLASAGDDRLVRLWDVTDPAASRTLGTPLTGHADPVNAAAFTADGHTLATAGNDDTVRLWDVTDPAAPRTLGVPLTAHTSWVTTVAFSADGHTLASAGLDRTVRLWDVTDPAAPRPHGVPLTGHTSWVNAVAFAPGGHTLASAGDDRTVRLWDVTDPAAPRLLGTPLTGHTNPVPTVAFAADGQTLASASSDNVVLWDVTGPAAAQPLGAPLFGHSDDVNAVAYAPDGHTLATTGDDGTVRLWDVTDPAAPRTLGAPLSGHTGWVHAVAFAADGHTLASAANDGTVRLWDVTDPTAPRALAAPLTAHTRLVFAVAFAPGGHTLASAGYDGTVRLWNVTDPAAPRALGGPLTGHTNPVHEVAFTRDGHTLASAGYDRTVRLWNVTDPAAPRPLGAPLTGHTNPVFAVAFSLDGHTLASVSSDNVVLWDVTDPAAPRPLGAPLTAHTSSVFAVAFAPGGHTLATASHDRTVRLWDVTDPAAPRPLGAPLTAHTRSVNALAFAPDGHTLASAGDDDTVRLWDLTHLEWLRAHAMERACTITGGGMSRYEWQRYLPGLDYVDVCQT